MLFLVSCTTTLLSYLAACPGDIEVFTGDGPLPMAIFELLEYIVNEVTHGSPLHDVHPYLLLLFNHVLIYLSILCISFSFWNRMQPPGLRIGLYL